MGSMPFAECGGFFLSRLYQQLQTFLLIFYGSVSFLTYHLNLGVLAMLSYYFSGGA